jgi:hypothetical protein
MKSKTIVLVLVMAMTLAAPLFGGTAEAAAPHVFLRHTTTSYIVNGASDYKPAKGKMTPPNFRFIYISVAPVVGSASGGILTLNPGGKMFVDHYADDDEYAGEEPVSGATDFPIVRHNENDYYCLVDDRDRHAEFYEDSETRLSRTVFSINLDGVVTNGKFPNLHTTKNQIDGKNVPYVEFVRDGARVSGLKWRFVDPRNPGAAIKREKASDVAEVRRITVYPKRGGDDLYNEAINVSIDYDSPVEGEVAFPSPIGADEIRSVSVFFDFADNMGDNLETEYAWRFFTE